jgi:hypothetical protein
MAQKVPERHGFHENGNGRALDEVTYSGTQQSRRPPQGLGLF